MKRKGLNNSPSLATSRTRSVRENMASGWDKRVDQDHRYGSGKTWNLDDLLAKQMYCTAKYCFLRTWLRLASSDLFRVTWGCSGQLWIVSRYRLFSWMCGQGDSAETTELSDIYSGVSCRAVDLWCAFESIPPDKTVKNKESLLYRVLRRENILLPYPSPPHIRFSSTSPFIDFGLRPQLNEKDYRPRKSVRYHQLVIQPVVS